jgi:metalloendopeptidase OMA1, mitochondrial
MKTIFFRILPGLMTTVMVMQFATGCSTVPITGRTQINFIPAGQEMQLGLSSFEKLKTDVPVNKNPALNERLQRVGKRIAAASTQDMPKAQWEFVLFESKEANAFCLPGGKVGVYTGILPITKDETGLATVIGHEVAHAVAHHGAERMSQAQLLDLTGQVVDAGATKVAAGSQSMVNAAYGLGSQLLIALPHSRSQESEADWMGLVYMARAGYDPAAAVSFWERFAAHNKAAGGQELWFLRTHPLDQERIKQLKARLPQAQQEYRPQK